MANQAKTAMVTGATPGIGAGLVHAFLKRGYAVVATSREMTRSETFSASDRLAMVDGDIGEAATAAKIANSATGTFGSIGVLVNNAGSIYDSIKHP